MTQVSEIRTYTKPESLRLALLAGVTLMMTAVIVADIQGVALSPLVGPMMADLGLDGAQVSWVLNGLTLVGAMFTGLISRLGDAVGPKRVLVPIILASLVGSVLCAVATDFTWLLVGRLLLGLGIPAVPLIWGLLRPRATAKQVQSISFWLGAVGSTGASLSLLLGGALMSLGFGWQSVFWVLAVGLIMMLVLTMVTPEAPDTVRSNVRLDALGGIGLGIWLAALLAALSWGPSLGWGSPTVLGAFAVAVVMLVLWVLQQIRTPHRLMAFHKSDARQMISGITGPAAAYGSAAFVFTFVPLLLQSQAEGYGFSKDVLGSTYPLLMMIPAVLGVPLFLAKLVARFGSRMVMVSGGVVGAAGLFGLALFHDEYWMFFLWVFLYQGGVMTAYLTGQWMVSASGRQDNISITVGTQYAGSNLVMAVAYAIAVGLLVPNAAGFFDESVFVSGFTIGGILCLVFVTTWLFLVPKRTVDRHAAVITEP